MVARDDSVIRGSLIASLIFLVLSFALNFFLWRSGSEATRSEAKKQEELTKSTRAISEASSKLDLLKSMVGQGNVTAAQFEKQAETVGADPEMNTILETFVADMKAFGPEQADEDRNYHKLPDYLINSIRSLNSTISQLKADIQKVRADAETRVGIAEKARDDALLAKAAAERLQQDEAEKNKKQLAEKDLAMEKARDAQTRTIETANKFRTQATARIAALQATETRLTSTITSQRQEINRLRNDSFESTQGKIASRSRDGEMVLVNLGSADKLRSGVTFGVFDAEETRIRDAVPKASIQVTRVRGPHLAEARVILKPEIGDPIIPSDKIYSPFWTPGRSVRIALAAEIDIDGDGKSDTDALRGMIAAAGAEIAAVIASERDAQEKLDSSIRFMVVDEIDEDADVSNPRIAQQIAAQGKMKVRANELGLTIIPAWKLQAFLRVIDDSLTTPLGSASKFGDFAPRQNTSNSSRLPSEVADLYRNDLSGQQRGKDIVSP